MRNSECSNLQTTTLILVRHGQARSGGTGLYGPGAHLSELGHIQAAALAVSLHSGPTLDAIYSSNLPRALETATAVANQLGLEVLIDNRLAEFDVDMGLATSVEERPDLLVWHPDHKGADGRTLSQFASTVAAFHEEVVDKHPGQRIAMICHAGTIASALS